MPFKFRLCHLALLISPFAFPVSSSAQGAHPPVQSEAAQAAQSAAFVTQNAQPDPATASAKPATSGESQQARIEADTTKLYQLALELRTEVGKTYKQSLSLSVLKKAAELEKLARSLKSEMDHEAFLQNR
jgi:hypothetical protein